MERHIQTVLLTIITAAIIWGSNQIFTLSFGMAKVQVTLEQLTAKSGKYATLDYVDQRGRARDQQLLEFDRRIRKLGDADERSHK